MSIQMYTQPIFIDERVMEYDPLTGSTSGQESQVIKKGMAMDFQVNLKVLSGDRYRVKSFTFTMVGRKASDEVVAANEVAQGIFGLIEAASRFASNIAYVSKGVIVGFYAKLGKYRQDEMPITVPNGDNSGAVLQFTNDDNSAYGQSHCETPIEVPVEPRSTRIFVPWLRDDLSRQDIKHSIDQWEFADDLFSYGIGQVKFRDELQTQLTASIVPFMQRMKVYEYSRNLGSLKVNNDTALGVKTDNVESELYNTFVEGVDDEDSSNDDDDNGNG